MYTQPRPSLQLTFISDFKEKNIPYDGDLSGIIPVKNLANVLSILNDTVHVTWDYAWWHTKDERFDELRKLETVAEIDRRDVELVITSVEKGNSEIINLDWSIAFWAAIWQSLPGGISANAIWDLAKYSVKSLWDLIHRPEDSHLREITDPLTNELLPVHERLGLEAFREVSEGGIVKTKIAYRSPAGEEIVAMIDYQAQQRILEANKIDFEIPSRLTGTIEGINYLQETIHIRFEQFPEHPTWCDISGFDFEEIEPY